MTAREYARLQGAPELNFGGATESQAKFALGDAVCVPVIEWLARHYLVPVVKEFLVRKQVETTSVYA
jgi:DNA (cytosine-5)-methyltransferase 1